MAINLTKAESMEQLDLRTKELKRICSKKYKLSVLRSRVALVLDISSSMKPLFDSGEAQAIIERFLPFALAFNNNNKMEFWTFNHEFRHYPPVTKMNYYSYLSINYIKPFGQTNYSPVINDTLQHFVMKDPSSKPTYIIFITDGDCNDSHLCDDLLRTASYHTVFYQFIGIGSNSRFKYLNDLDHIAKSLVNNTNFFAAQSLTDDNVMSDKELYSQLLYEYSKWISIMNKKGILDSDYSCVLKKDRNEKKKDKAAKIILGVLDLIRDILESL